MASGGQSYNAPQTNNSAAGSSNNKDSNLQSFEDEFDDEIPF